MLEGVCLEDMKVPHVSRHTLDREVSDKVVVIVGVNVNRSKVKKITL